MLVKKNLDLVLWYESLCCVHGHGIAISIFNIYSYKAFLFQTADSFTCEASHVPHLLIL